MGNGDSFKKVRSGEPLVIPAETYNAFIDAVGWVKQQQRDERSHGGHLADQRCVMIRNDSGGDLSAQSVLAVTGVVFDPAGGGNVLSSFRAEPVLIGSTPATADAGKFVILAEPIHSGAIGLAYAAGSCAVQVNITDASHKVADVSDGTVASLASGQSGAATILWKQAASGLVWCVVRFGGAAGSLPDGENEDDLLWWRNDKWSPGPLTLPSVPCSVVTRVHWNSTSGCLEVYGKSVQIVADGSEGLQESVCFVPCTS
jgi:hypothetical protein